MNKITITKTVTIIEEQCNYFHTEIKKQKKRLGLQRDYIRKLQTKLNEALNCQWCGVGDGMYHADDCRYWDSIELTRLKTKEKGNKIIFFWLPLISWLIAVGAIAIIMIFT